MKHFSWEGTFDIPRILGYLAARRIIGKNGGVSFKSHEYNYWLPVLESAIRVHEDIGQQLKHLCIMQAVNDSTVTLKDSEAFLQRCETAYERLSARAKKKFVVVFSMTYSGEPLFSRVIDGDVRIQWQAKSNTKFMRKARAVRNDLLKEIQNRRVTKEPRNLTNLIAHVSAYDAFDAHTLATDSIDCLRGMLNLFVNSNRGINPFARMAHPHAVNRFRNGPYRTVHNLDGSLATGTLWYEIRWAHETPSVKFDSADKVRKNLKTWWKRLQQNPLNNHIKQGLLRYCRALDMHDADPSLTEMWGALESLTGTQRVTGDITVNRIAQLFINRDDERQIANHIRVRRNLTVHAARTLNQHETDAILLHAEGLVARILFFCLKYGKRFTDRNELYNFLDLKLDAAKLKRTVALSKFFVEYQNRNPPNSKQA